LETKPVIVSARDLAASQNAKTSQVKIDRRGEGSFGAAAQPPTGAALKFFRKHSEFHKESPVRTAGGLSVPGFQGSLLCVIQQPLHAMFGLLV
jgi:hypothetical protein